MADTSKRLIIIIGVVLLGIVGVFGLFEYSSQPTFCTNCHEIAPFVDQWSTSVHSNVNCIKCHAEPGTFGKVKRKVYSVKEIVGHFQGKEPGAVPTQVPNKNCLQSGCHVESKVLASMTFNHEYHFSNIEDLNCIHCHRGVGHSKDVFTQEMQTESELCTKCHG